MKTVPYKLEMKETKYPITVGRVVQLEVTEGTLLAPMTTKHRKTISGTRVR